MSSHLVRRHLAQGAVALACAFAVGAWSGRARADRAPEAWPVRSNLSLPLGDTFGAMRFQGFTWGFRASVDVHPTDAGHGVGFGPFGEVLLDQETHSRWTLGSEVYAPLMSGGGVDWRIGGLAGWTSTADATNGGTRNEVTFGVGTHVAVPAYLYDFRIGVQLRTSASRDGFTCTSVLVDLDLVALLALAGYAR